MVKVMVRQIKKRKDIELQIYPKQEEPVIKQEEPVIKQEEPVIKQEEPVIKQEEPVIKKEEAPKKRSKAQLTAEDLDKLEKEAVVNLTKGLAEERDNVSWVRLALDFLKAKHPSYRDKKDQILPQEYKMLWEEVVKDGQED
jgi:hypothetical protein